MFAAPSANVRLKVGNWGINAAIFLGASTTFQPEARTESPITKWLNLTSTCLGLNDSI